MKTYRLTDKILSQHKKLSLSDILKLFLNSSKFETQYSYKLYSYIKKVYSPNLGNGNQNMPQQTKGYRNSRLQRLWRIVIKLSVILPLAHSAPCQICKMERFVKVINGF